MPDSVRLMPLEDSRRCFRRFFAEDLRSVQRKPAAQICGNLRETIIVRFQFKGLGCY